MKHIVESVEEMYHARQPTGEVIVDEVINILRNYKLIYPEDVALLMDVKVRDLRAAWFMLTGTRLVDVITHWRVLQAQDWLRKRLGEISTERCEKGELVKLLKETARHSAGTEKLIYFGGSTLTADRMLPHFAQVS